MERETGDETAGTETRRQELFIQSCGESIGSSSFANESSPVLPPLSSSATLNIAPKPEEIVQALKQRWTLLSLPQSAVVVVHSDGESSVSVANAAGDIAASKEDGSMQGSSIGRKRKENVESSLRHICQYCGKEYKSDKWLKHHIQLKHGDGDDNSGDDDSDDSNDEAFVAEMIATKFSKNFVCEHCKKRYKSFVGLKYHLETQHTDPATAASFDCEECGKHYRSNAGLKYHLQHHHSTPSITETLKSCNVNDVPSVQDENDSRNESANNEIQQLEDGTWVCLTCGKKDKSARDIFHHIDMTHARKKPRIDTTGHGMRRSAQKALRTFACQSDQDDDACSVLSHHSDDNEYASSVQPSESMSKYSTKTSNIHHKAKSSRVRTATASEITEIQESQKQIINVNTSNWKDVFTTDQVIDIEKRLRQGRKLKCFNKDCDKSLGTAVGLAYHYQRCGRQTPQYLCEICHAVYSSQAGLTYHMRNVHAPNVTIDFSADMISEDSEDMDWSFPDESSGAKLKETRNAFVSERKRQKHQHLVESIANVDLTLSGTKENLFSGRASNRVPSARSKEIRRVKLLAADPRAKGWTETSRARYSHNCVLEDLTPHSAAWTLVSPNEASSHLPTAQLSSPFVVKNIEKGGKQCTLSRKESNSRNDRDEPHQVTNLDEDSSVDSNVRYQLKLFEYCCLSSVYQDESLVFNAGGPVWAMDWCPQPEGSDCVVEYCAISVHHTSDETHSVGRAFNGKGVIQLWAIKDSHSLSAHMDIAIAHGWGCVWDIKWSPQAWQCERHEFANETEWRRLGVLAVACSTGKVQILSIPHPSHLKQSQSLDYALYHAQPNVTLIPGAVGHHKDGQHGQAWCVSWRPDDGHSQVAAGFSDGSVGIWRIDTKCPWLQVKANGGDSSLPGKVLLPVQQFFAHGAVVRSLCWSAVNTDIIATAAHGRDSVVRVWNLNDVSTPVQDLGQLSGWVYEMQWLTYWNILGTVGDYTPVSKVKRHAELVMLNKLSSHKQPNRRPLCPRPSPFMSTSFSEWHNTLAFGSADGCVCIHILPSLASSVVSLDGDWDLFSISEEKPENSDDVVIVFSDYDMQKFAVTSAGNPKGTRKSEIASHTVLSSPLSAVNKVRWNPNYKHRLWLLSGTKSGLVRLTRLLKLREPHTM